MFLVIAGRCGKALPGGILASVNVNINRGNLKSFQQRRTISFEPFVSTLHSLTDSLQYVHQISGLPWYIFIPISTFVLRSVLTLPLAILNRKRLQRQNSLRPLINAMGPVIRHRLGNKHYQQEQRQQQQQQQKAATDLLAAPDLSYEKIMLLSTKEVRKRQKKIFKENKCQIWKNFTLPLLQIPLWISLSLTFRNLTGWRADVLGYNVKPIDPTLSTEGFQWITDLTLPDPYNLLPFLLGLMALSNVEYNYKNIQLMNLTNKGKKLSFRPTIFDMATNLSRFSIAFFIAVSTQAPAALGLYWISSNGFSLLQNILMDKFLPLSYSPYSNASFKKAAEGSVPLIKNL
ncbi:hypothetical protein PACTADRAFT_3928 [Pachysolen tannophilus NRRL Y-2460]|uniref:Membrane insertase YidC/Oxa/ALB C-terminal domain-containing protein n=1 Tax=Pachysolen tannophilus NRRL Y-2460 TaxID=669874 RepID=A0A1E4TTH9_PACTA|nr:hypothetical protein PACTADRAFT_3928 [Pachysolen tannophilus NRRL Y-2460]